MPRIGLAEVEISLMSPLFFRKRFRYARLKSVKKGMSNESGGKERRHRLFGAFNQFGVLAYKSTDLGHFRSIHQVAVFGL